MKDDEIKMCPRFVLHFSQEMSLAANVLKSLILFRRWGTLDGSNALTDANFFANWTRDIPETHNPNQTVNWEKYLAFKDKLYNNAATTIANDERKFLLRLVQDYFGDNALKFEDIYSTWKVSTGGVYVV